MMAVKNGGPHKSNDNWQAPKILKMFICHMSLLNISGAPRDTLNYEDSHQAQSCPLSMRGSHSPHNMSAPHCSFSSKPQVHLFEQVLTSHPRVLSWVFTNTSL